MADAMEDTEPREDRVTIKVKIGGEDYHDIVIDWSDGKDTSQILIDQLSLLTGIPCENIDCVIVNCVPGHVYISNSGPSRIDRDKFPREKYNAYITDGDCFAIAFDFDYYMDRFISRLNLVSRQNYDDELCTRDFCQYSNARPMLNRRIKIMKNAALLAKFKAILRAAYIPTSTGRVMAAHRANYSCNIQPYITAKCKRNPYSGNPFSLKTYYPRTHG
ncbi:uncharacterized protein LOC107359429 [Tetranychus urticae]|uniref:Uncharacterized protein n=1 Tax=Tetranychus urticae TaxID=32264 RepID=T1K2N3_TETUR|nr:uncharacterized protein LOC107359429 [Tetranychus urticae]